jgi:hypothetical protein
MEAEELKNYQKLTKFQKEVIDALLNLGFKYKYNSTYELIGWGDIQVERFSRWSDVLKEVHEQGKNQKRYEIQRALGI